MKKLTGARLPPHINISLILLPQRPHHRRPRRDPRHPRHQIRKLLHLLGAEAGECPAFDPGPGSHVGDGVFALVGAGEVVPRREWRRGGVGVVVVVVAGEV